MSIKLKECEAPKERDRRRRGRQADQSRCGLSRRRAARMSVSMPGLVQTSSNLARVVSDGKSVKLQCLLRSSVNSEKAALGEAIAAVFSGRGQGAAHGQLRRLESEHGVADPQGHDRFLQGPLRQGTRRDGDPRRTRMRHHRQQISQDGHDFVPDPRSAIPIRPTRRWRSRRWAKFYDFMVDTLRNIPKK